MVDITCQGNCGECHFRPWMDSNAVKAFELRIADLKRDLAEAKRVRNEADRRRKAAEKREREAAAAARERCIKAVEVEPDDSQCMTTVAHAKRNIIDRINAPTKEVKE